jgi:hypothetical protein
VTDNNWRVYKELFKWHNDINEWLTNHNNLNATDRSQYKAEMTIRLKDQTYRDTLVYKYIGVWPSDINGITLDWNENKAADFQVTFIFDYVAIVAGNGNDNVPLLTTKSNSSSTSTVPVSENEASGLLPQGTVTGIAGIVT